MGVPGRLPDVSPYVSVSSAAREQPDYRRAYSLHSGSEIGLTLLLNKFVKWGCLAGSLMFLLMYLSLLPPENNPIIDEHIVYILVLILVALASKDRPH